MESGIAEDEEAGQSGMDPSRPDTLSRRRRSIDLRALDERAEKDLHDHLQKVRVRFLAKDPNVTRGEGPGERKYGKHARSAPRSEPLIIQPRKGRPARWRKIPVVDRFRLRGTCRLRATLPGAAGPPACGGLGNRGAAHASLCMGREHGGTQAVSRRSGSPREAWSEGPKVLPLRKLLTGGILGRRAGAPFLAPTPR